MIGLTHVPVAQGGLDYCKANPELVKKVRYALGFQSPSAPKTRRTPQPLFSTTAAVVTVSRSVAAIKWPVAKGHRSGVLGQPQPAGAHPRPGPGRPVRRQVGHTSPRAYC